MSGTGGKVRYDGVPRLLHAGAFFSIYLLAFLAAWPSHADAQASPQAFDLNQIIHLALANNPGLAASREGIEVEQRGRQAAWSQRLPRIAVQAMNLGDPLNTQLVMPMHQFVPPTTASSAAVLNTFRSEFSNDNYNFGFGMTLPIYTGGRITAQTRIGDLAILLSQNRLAQTRDELIFNVASVFYTILRLDQDVTATAASLKGLQESQRIVKQRLAVGEAAQLDVYKIDARLAEVQQALIQVNNDRSVGYTALVRLVGGGPTAEGIAAKGPLTYRENTLRLEDSIAAAVDKRPELLAKMREVAIAKQQVRVALAQRLPQLSVGADYLWWGSALYGHFGNQYSPAPDILVTTSLQFPIFDEVARQQYDEALARQQQVARELDDLRLRVIQEVKSAFLSMEAARARITAAQAALREAEEALRIEQAKISVGKSTTEFLLDAQAAELRSRFNYFGAISDYDIQQMALRKAIGQITVD